VKSVYVRSDRALATYEADTERREAIRAARRQAARDRSIVEAAQRALREAVAQELASAGYHLRKGQIRKKRDIPMTQELIPSPANAGAVGTLAQRAVLLIVEGAEPQIRDEILTECNRVMAEVGATATGAVELLLVQELALAWIEVFRLRMGYAQLPPAQAAFRTRSIDSAQLRWLRSVEILRRVQQRAVGLIESGG
jgi:hypothetical protein